MAHGTSPANQPTALQQQRLVHDAEGLNTGVWPVRVDRLLTPTDCLFTRSHAPVPKIDAAVWRLEVDGLVDRPTSFSLDELARAFPQRRLVATLVCAGLRRDEFLPLGPLPGELPWGPEPAGTGEWTGISLCDLLQAIGVGKNARHVQFVGLDQVEREGHHFGYGASIDLSKAEGPEVLLATGLNGMPLPAVHGFPLRVVVPGWIGARSVKWLGRITLLEEPSLNYFQRKAYRLARVVNRKSPRDVSRGVALSEIPLNSVIVQPTAGQVLQAGKVDVRGWAIGSGGRPLTGVEVSANEGRDWTEARIPAEGAGWAWSLWQAELDLPSGRHTLVVRATDSAGIPQPSDVNATWNVKGYNNNAWHRVTIDLG
jgi:sulfite oxidase